MHVLLVTGLLYIILDLLPKGTVLRKLKMGFWKITEECISHFILKQHGADMSSQYEVIKFSGHHKSANNG